jgi:hypothetical protein
MGLSIRKPGKEGGARVAARQALDSEPGCVETLRRSGGLAVLLLKQPQAACDALQLRIMATHVSG